MLRPAGVVSVLALVATLAATPDAATAQVFLGSRAKPDLTVTPLFVVASVSPDTTDVPVEVLFSILIPSGKSALDLEQDLYLLWPGEVTGTTQGASGIALPEDVAAQVTVIREGKLALLAQPHYDASAQAEPMASGAPFVTVVRTGGPMGTSLAATYVRIPWNARLANQAWLMSVRFTAKDLIKAKPTTWLGRTFTGPRNVLSLGFNDVGSTAMFSMYYWQRESVLPVASPARLVVNFAASDRLAVDALFPPAARREPNPSLKDTDAVSLFLTATEGLTPQVLRAEFGYFSRLQSWGPILVPALFFALGNVAGVLIRNVAERLFRQLGERLQFGRRRASAQEVETGAVIAGDRLAAIIPGETTYEDVLRLCGTEVEERRDLARPNRKTLVYRGRRDVPHRRWAWSWLAAVSHWDIERHEVEITVDDGIVHDIQVRIGRARSTPV